MKLQKPIRKMAVLLSLLVMTTLASCSKKDSMEVIPSDVDMAFTVNLRRVLDQTGCEITDEEIKLPEQYKIFAQSLPEEVRETIIKTYRSIDTERIAGFGYIKIGEPEYYIVTGIKDEKTLDDVLTGELELKRENTEGFASYAPANGRSDMSVLIKDGLMWLAPGNDPAKTAKSINRIVKKAEKSSIAGMSALNEVLTAGKAFNFVANAQPMMATCQQAIAMLDPALAALSGSVIEKIKGYWSVSNTDLEGTELTWVTKYIKPESGEVLCPESLKNVTPAFLDFVPDYYCMAWAGATSREYLIPFCNAVESLIDNKLSGAKAAMAKKAIGWVRMIDGTIGMAAGAADPTALIYGGDPVKARTGFVAVLEMTEGAPAKVIAELVEILKELSMNNIEATPESAMITLSPEFKLFLRASGNSLVVSNEPITTGNKSPLAKWFEDNQGAAVFDLPSLAPLTANSCTFGFRANLSYDKGIGTAKIEFPRAEGNIIDVITLMIGGFNAGNNEYVRADEADTFSDDSYQLSNADTLFIE